MALQRISASQIQTIRVRAAKDPDGIYLATQTEDGVFHVALFQTMNTAPINRYISTLDTNTDWVVYTPSTQRLDRRP